MLGLGKMLKKDIEKAFGGEVGLAFGNQGEKKIAVIIDGECAWKGLPR
jgi:hypothetical protein